MRISLIKKQLSAPLLIPGLVFLGVNLTTSYMFYHVNSYKIFLSAVGICLLAIRNTPFLPSTYENKIPWKTWGILALPLLATFPGYILYKGSHNYNFRYELVSNLILILWAGYLYRGARNEDDLSPFTILIGVTFIYAGLWSVLEKVGYHPAMPNAGPVDMVKSTFGHRNYFSGFLILLLPLFLILAIPDNLFSALTLKKMLAKFTKSNLFYMAVLMMGGLSLLLAQTRAAIAACAASFLLVGYLYSRFFFTERWKKRFNRLFLATISLAAISGSLMYILADHIKGSRFVALFTLKAWLGRLLPWETAISSIKDSPFFGFGLGSSYNLFFSYVDPDSRLYHSERSYNHAHSEFLEYLQESGGLGLVIFVCFWGFLIFQLIKVLRNPSSSTESIKLAIAVSGGFLAYHIHGTFSVAPRMMVMKLPLFTLFGFLFLLGKFNLPVTPAATPPTLVQKIWVGIPTLVIIALIWSLYLPWITGQYLFVKIQSERQSLIKTEKLENLVRDLPDIYALDTLAHLQISYQRKKELAETVQTIESIIPHYREVGRTKAILAALNGNYDKAKELALEYQQRDRYNIQNIHFLIGLAVKANDAEFFFQQIQLLQRRLIFQHGLIDSLQAADVQISKKGINTAIIVKENDNKLDFQWNEEFIDQIFKSAKTMMAKKSYDSKEINQFGSFILSWMSRSPYFQVKIHEQFKKQKTESIRKAIYSYFQAKRHWEIQKKELQESHRLQLRKQMQTRPAVIPALRKKQASELKEMRNKYWEKIKPLENELKQKTEWNLFLKKQAFLNDFIPRLVSIVFPPLSKR